MYIDILRGVNPHYDADIKGIKNHVKLNFYKRSENRKKTHFYTIFVCDSNRCEPKKSDHLETISRSHGKTCPDGVRWSQLQHQHLVLQTLKVKSCSCGAAKGLWMAMVDG